MNAVWHSQVENAIFACLCAYLSLFLQIILKVEICFPNFFKHQPVAANTEEKVHLNVQSDLESSENNMVLRTEDLVKKYRQRTVVNHVSIDVTQGEIVGLLGPNGAGKTTTFYMRPD